MTTHTFKRGDKVTVFCLGQGNGRMRIEGSGTIASLVRDVDEQYRVKFHDGVFERFVDPWGQSDPKTYVEKFNAAMDKQRAVS